MLVTKEEAVKNDIEVGDTMSATFDSGEYEDGWIAVSPAEPIILKQEPQ